MGNKVVDPKVISRIPHLAYPAIVLAMFASLVRILLDNPDIWGNWPLLLGVFLGYVMMAVLGGILLRSLRPTVGSLAPGSEMVTHTLIVSALHACRRDWRNARMGGVLYTAVSNQTFDRLAVKILAQLYVLRKR
jgi:hypothetical protein